MLTPHTRSHGWWHRLTQSPGPPAIYRGRAHSRQDSLRVLLPAYFKSFQHPEIRIHIFIQLIQKCQHIAVLRQREFNSRPANEEIRKSPSLRSKSFLQNHIILIISRLVEGMLTTLHSLMEYDHLKFHIHLDIYG